MWSSTVLSGTERDTRELKAESGGGTYLSPENIPLGGGGHSQAEDCSICLMQTSA